MSLSQASDEAPLWKPLVICPYEVNDEPPLLFMQGWLLLRRPRPCKTLPVDVGGIERTGFSNC